jgi:hypothetical protein
VAQEPNLVPVLLMEVQEKGLPLQWAAQLLA